MIDRLDMGIAFVLGDFVLRADEIRHRVSRCEELSLSVEGQRLGESETGSFLRNTQAPTVVYLCPHPGIQLRMTLQLVILSLVTASGYQLMLRRPALVTVQKASPGSSAVSGQHPTANEAFQVDSAPEEAYLQCLGH